MRSALFDQALEKVPYFKTEGVCNNMYLSKDALKLAKEPLGLHCRHSFKPGAGWGVISNEILKESDDSFYIYQRIY